MRCDARGFGRRERRRALIVIAALMIVLAPLAGEAQPAAKVYRIGYIHSAAPPPAPIREVFELHLRELGWIDGQNVVIEDRFAQEVDRLPDVVALLRLNVDVLVATDTPAAKASREATHTLPIVITAGSPDRTGLIASLARPGGNITGLDVATVDVRAKSLELLREVSPTASHFAFLGNPDNPAQMRSWEDLEAAALSLGVKMRRFDVRKASDIDSAFALMARTRFGGVVVASDPTTLIPHRRKVLDLAAKLGLPALYPWRYFVEAGGLMSYGSDVRHNGRLLATYVDRILKGAKPADLPVERSAKLELVINKRTARMLGVQIPPSLLVRADEVIE